MRKKMILLVGVLALCLALSGCGNKDKKAADKTVQDTENDKKEGEDIVSMEKDVNKVDKSKITKFLGTKTANAGEVVITNETGREISEFYMRPTPAQAEGEDEDYEDSSWGADLTQDKFTLKDKEQALLYYDKDSKDSSGKAVKNYDLQAAYKNMDAAENCFFRDLDLTVMEEITLHLDDGIPYVKYKNTATNKEVSTLAEVKKRLGITGSGDKNADVSQTPAATETPAATQTPDATETPAVTETPDPTTAPPDPAVNPKQKAEGYIGSSVDGLFADSDIGHPVGYDEDEDPATGAAVKFYYYDGFTVYAAVNDDGSETIQDVY